MKLRRVGLVNRFGAIIFLALTALVPLNCGRLLTEEEALGRVKFFTNVELEYIYFLSFGTMNTSSRIKNEVTVESLLVEIENRNIPLSDDHWIWIKNVSDLETRNSSRELENIRIEDFMEIAPQPTNTSEIVVSCQTYLGPVQRKFLRISYHLQWNVRENPFSQSSNHLRPFFRLDYYFSGGRGLSKLEGFSKKDLLYYISNKSFSGWSKSDISGPCGLKS